MAVHHLLYLHGFRSSPESTKARIVQDRVTSAYPGVHFWCPQLCASPRLAMTEVLAGISRWPKPDMAVMGSSLGGYYATWIAELAGCRAAVLNPAVHAVRDLATQVGTHTQWHQPAVAMEFTGEHVQELGLYRVETITRPQRYYALIAKGDEVLDWHEMSAHYPGAHGRLLEGGDHAISGFGSYVDEILEFLDLAR